jgi:hypothetical protein
MSEDNIFNFNIDLESLKRDTEAVCANFDLYDEKSVEAATFAMIENVESLLGKSMRIVPHDEGHLEGSGSAKVNNVIIAQGKETDNADADPIIELTGNQPKASPGSVIEGVVSYNKPYAARQHEELSYNHKEGRQAKYLESPLKEFVREFCQNIADAVKNVRR